MVKSEFIRLKNKKSIYILPIITLLCAIGTIINNYVVGVDLALTDPAMSNNIFETLKIENIFFFVMKEIFLSIYVFPLIIIGVIWIYGDLKDNILLQVSILTKHKLKYFFTKILIIMAYFAVVLISYFFIFVFISSMLTGVDNSTWINIFSIYSVLAFIIFLFGITFWAIASMVITYIGNSAIAGAGSIIFYLMFERVFTSITSFTFRNPFLMKVNEYLPWSNFNTLAVYGSNLKNIVTNGMTESNLSELTMFHLSSTQVSGFTISVPYMKSIESVISVICIYTIILLAVFWKIFKVRMSKS